MDSQHLMQNDEFRKQFVNLKKHLQEIEKIELYIKERKDKLQSRPQAVLHNKKPNDMTNSEKNFMLGELKSRLLTPEVVAARKEKLAKIADLTMQCQKNNSKIQYQYNYVNQQVDKLKEQLPELDSSVFEKHPYLNAKATWYRIWLQNGGNLDDEEFANEFKNAKVNIGLK